MKAKKNNTVGNEIIRKIINYSDEAEQLVESIGELAERLANLKDESITCEAEEVVKDAFDDILKELKYDISNGKIVLEIIEKALLKLQWRS